MGSLISITGKPLDADREAIDAAFSVLFVGKKESSIAADRNAVSHWFRWFGYNIPSRADILRYIDHARKDLHHSNKTIRGAFVRLRRGFEPFGLRDEFTAAMRLVRISSTPERREIKLIPFERLGRVLESPDVNTPRGRRDRCLVALLIGGGLRISEALALKIGDVRFTPAGTLYVRLEDTKCGTPAVQAISPRCASIVSELADIRRAESDASAPLLTSYNHRGKPNDLPVLRRNASRKFSQLARKVGVRASTHSCRATAITKLLADGIPHREVQEFSRHASVAMVEVYDKRTFGIDQSPSGRLDF